MEVEVEASWLKEEHLEMELEWMRLTEEEWKKQEAVKKKQREAEEFA